MTSTDTVSLTFDEFVKEGQADKFMCPVSCLTDKPKKTISWYRSLMCHLSARKRPSIIMMDAVEVKEGACLSARHDNVKYQIGLCFHANLYSR